MFVRVCARWQLHKCNKRFRLGLNITGDLATTKKTIQTLNNRINGMHSPKIAEQELMMQLLQKRGNAAPNGQIKNVGG